MEINDEIFRHRQGKQRLVCTFYFTILNYEKIGKLYYIAKLANEVEKKIM